MSTRIEKTQPIFSRVLNAESADKIQRKHESAQDQNSKNQYQQQQQNQKQKREYTREDVEKAVIEINASDEFKNSGLTAKILESATTEIKIGLYSNALALLREIGAQEFLDLKETSTGEKKPRGKLLDQKF